MGFRLSRTIIPILIPLVLFCVGISWLLVSSAPSITGTLYDGVSEDAVEPGTDNVLLGSIEIALETDEIVYNGSSYVISEGDELTELENDLYYTENAIGAYDPSGANGVVVRSTNNATFDTADEIVIEGTFVAPLTTLVEDTYITSSGWIDEDGDESFDYPDEFSIAINFNPTGVSNGDTVRLFANNEVWVTKGSNSSDEGESFHGDDESEGAISVEPAFINDNDGDGHLSAGDTVRRAGVNNMEPFTSDDNVCFDGSISDDSEFDYTDANNYEVIWWDLAGDCSSFTTGVDVIITGKSGGVDVAPSGTSTEFGTEGEVGFIDINEDATYDCSRGSTCQEIAYTGVTGTNWTSDGGFTLSTVFFDPSAEATDGLSTVGDDWYSPAYSTLNTMVDLSDDEVDDADPFYAYVDSDGDTNYDLDEPIISRETNSATEVLETGDTIRLFKDYYKYFHLGPSPTNGNMFMASTALVVSADLVQDVGLADGSSGDTYFYIPGTQGSFSLLVDSEEQELRYYDHNASGSLETGDDIIDHIQGSEFYNALAVGSLQIAPGGNGIDAVDASFDEINLYTPATATCAGEGTDSLIGSKLESPFLSTSITITTSPARLFYSNNGEVENKICIYGDVANTALLGSDLEIVVDQVDFEGGTSVTSIMTNSSASLSVYDVIEIVPVVTPAYTGQANSISFSTTFAYDTVDDISISMAITSEADISSASMSCTIDDVAIPGSSGSGSFGPLVFVMFVPTDDSLAFSSGEELECTISNVVGPDDPGTYMGSQIVINSDGGSVIVADQEISLTFTDEEAPDDDTGGRVIPLPTYDVEITSPNGGEGFFMRDPHVIRWDSNPEVKFVNLYYSLNGGDSYEVIAESLVNTGAYDWTVPAEVTKEGFIKIESTDGQLIFNTDISDGPFSIFDRSLYLKWRQPSSNSSLLAGSEQLFLWTSSDEIKEVSLAYSVEGEGIELESLVERIPNENNVTATLPDLETDELYFHLTGYTESNQALEISEGPFSLVYEEATAYEIMITNPSRREIYAPGDELSIQWDTEGDIPFTEVLFTADGAKWSVISPYSYNKGLYDWIIPPIETQYGLLRVQGLAVNGSLVSDTLDEPFWIVLPDEEPIDHSIDFTSPKAGSFFYRDTGDVLVEWNSSELIQTFSLYLIDRETNERFQLASRQLNEDNYSWSILNAPIASYNLFIEGFDDKEQLVASDSLFNITLADRPAVIVDEDDDGDGDTSTAETLDPDGDADVDIDDDEVEELIPPKEDEIDEDIIILDPERPAVTDPVIEEEPSHRPLVVLEEVSETLTRIMPVTVIVYSAFTLGLLSLLFGLINWLHFFFNTPIWLLWRRKKYHGLVFDALTGLPVSFATIRFYDLETNVLRKTAVTDQKGRYVVRLNPGSYRPDISKDGYVFPSEYVDQLMLQSRMHIYKVGTPIVIAKESSFVRLQFPVDSSGAKHSFFRQATHSLLSYGYRFVSLVLLLASLFTLLYEPTLVRILLFVVQFIVAVLFYFLSVQTVYPESGQVLGDAHKPVAGAVVRLFNATYNKLIETQVTNAKGNFGFIVGPGMYNVRAEYEGRKSPEIQITVKDGDGGVISPTLELADVKSDGSLEDKENE